MLGITPKIFLAYKAGKRGCFIKRIKVSVRSHNISTVGQ